MFSPPLLAIVIYGTEAVRGFWKLTACWAFCFRIYLSLFLNLLQTCCVVFGFGSGCFPVWQLSKCTRTLSLTKAGARDVGGRGAGGEGAKAQGDSAALMEIQPSSSLLHCWASCHLLTIKILFIFRRWQDNYLGSVVVCVVCKGYTASIKSVLLSWVISRILS